MERGMRCLLESFGPRYPDGDRGVAGTSPVEPDDLTGVQCGAPGAVAAELTALDVSD